MREIKFRGKRISDGEWVYGYYTTINNNHGMVSAIVTGTDRGCFIPELVGEKTVGQYIPKGDFYEGDVLYGEERDGYGTRLGWWQGVVQYDETAGRIRIKDDSGDWYETDDFAYDKLVGNIHDNPELLKME